MNNKRVNLLHVVLSLNVGGLEKVVLNLAKYLDGELFNLSICCLDEFGGLEQDFREFDVDLVLVKRREIGTGFIILTKLMRLIKDKEIDVIHAHNFSPSFYAAIAGRLCNVSNIVTTYHNRRFFEEISSKRVFAFRALCHLNHETTFVSNDAREIAINTCKIPHNKVSVIHNGIDTNEFRPRQKSRSLLDEFDLRDKIIIGSVGRLSKEKNILKLLRAYTHVRDKIESIRLLIVGDGPEKADLIEEAKRLDISSHVIFAGYRENIAELLNTMDIFVMTSSTEGISLTLLEAMATQKAVIATRVGGNPEVIRDGHTGILVAPNDLGSLLYNLNLLIQDDDKRKQLGYNAREAIIEKFSIEKMVNKYGNHYFKTIGH